MIETNILPDNKRTLNDRVQLTDEATRDLLYSGEECEAFKDLGEAAFLLERDIEAWSDGFDWLSKRYRDASIPLAQRKYCWWLFKRLYEDWTDIDAMKRGDVDFGAPEGVETLQLPAEVKQSMFAALRTRLRFCKLIALYKTALLEIPEGHLSRWIGETLERLDARELALLGSEEDNDDDAEADEDNDDGLEALERIARGNGGKVSIGDVREFWPE